MNQPLEYNMVVRLVEEVRGQRTVVANEIYRNLSHDATSPRFAKNVVNAASSLVTIEVLELGSGELPEATHPDAIGQVFNVQDAAFKSLGVEGGTSGFDGYRPDSTNWINSEGREAIAPVSQTGGLYLLDRIAPDIFNLLCIPAAAYLSPTSMTALLAAAAVYCQDKRAFLIVDISDTQDSQTTIKTWINGSDKPPTNYAAVYFPRLKIPDPLDENRLRTVGPSGTLAGVYARIDATRGVWKAPAGTEASLRGGVELTQVLTDLENGGLNPLGVNVLRNFPIFGNVAWGARTLEGSDQQASEWKYVPVRRTALFIEESLYQGLKWVVFEPNDEPLWSQIRLNVGAFMQGLFRQGAFQGKTPREAYFVKCDSETTTQNDINQGIVNILVGFAPLKPAEFVIIKLQQMAGQIQV
jgi:phage tail sheath protein FI